MPDSHRAVPAATVRRLGLAALLLGCAPLGWALAATPKKAQTGQPGVTPPAAPTAAAKKPPAAKPGAPVAKAATRPKEAVPKFTNDDLPKVSSEREDETAEAEESADPQAEDASGSKAKKTKAKAGDPEIEEEEDEKDFEDVLGEEERAARTVVLQRQLADAEKRIGQLESRRRALQNPLHAGLFPAGTEEQDAVGGQGNDVRLAWVEEQIRATRKAMDRDREELARIQAP